MQYEEYHKCLDTFLIANGITADIPKRRRMFDHFIWYQYRGKN